MFDLINFIDLCRYMVTVNLMGATHLKKSCKHSFFANDCIVVLFTFYTASLYFLGIYLYIFIKYVKLDSLVSNVKAYTCIVSSVGSPVT